jgi:hypothetical protein
LGEVRALDEGVVVKYYALYTNPARGFKIGRINAYGIHTILKRYA